MAKVNFLAIAVLFVSLILIANAAEENASESYNTIDEISNLSYSNSTVNDEPIISANLAQNTALVENSQASSANDSTTNNINFDVGTASYER